MYNLKYLGWAVVGISSGVAVASFTFETDANKWCDNLNERVRWTRRTIYKVVVLENRFDIINR
jgi:3-methyladenine DNA glycosylase AlkD